MPESDVGIQVGKKEDDKKPEVDCIPVPVPGEDFEHRKPRISRRPLARTKADIEEHFPLHLNYRAWCAHCVAGKARLSQHASGDPDRERLGITWSADYAFMVAEEEEEGMQPTLVMYDDDKQSFWAIGVNQKGVTESIVKYCVATMDQSGHQGEKLTFKTDQEPSTIALKRAESARRCPSNRR